MKRELFLQKELSLFNRGGIFYSRRIGGDLSSSGEDFTQENEKVSSSDNSIDLNQCN